MIEDEGPSSEDLDRFDHDTAYCTACGAEIWDQIDICPECGEHLPDGPQRTPPHEFRLENKWLAVIVALVVLGLLAVLGRGWF